VSRSEPLWTATARHLARPRLEGARRFDVVVVGGGITGVTAALSLKRAGLSVGLVEMGRVGHGVTGHTTAKVTSLHQLAYAELEERFGADTARVYAEANQAGLRTVAELVDELGIDCAFERRPAVTYTTDEGSASAIEAEVAAARRAGLAARLVHDTDLPFPVAAAIQVEDQAQFHPVDYVLALAEAVDGRNCAVFEGSRVVDVPVGEPCRVQTPEGGVEADHVVLATQLPLLDRGLFFAKAHPSRSYALSVTADGPLPEGMYINVEEPTRSMRPYVRDGRQLLVVSGEGHKPGASDDEAAHWDALESWAREHFAVGEVTHRWSAHDYVPVDKMPYVGQAARTQPNAWVATGFRKWGFTAGTMAALILADLIQGRANPWAATFDANRVTPVQSARSFVSENLEVAAHFVADRVGLPGREAVESLGPGEGAVVRVDGEAYAVARDDGGTLQCVSPVCTHMGCHVSWNTAERTWDCPCHGSRFSAGGQVVQGPAVRDLDEKPLP
jgi:glycine/D-amino acid oxidase-like deaminating enzyme/nitrite reductase/ring-hydroxylating ferredoxin subunit